MLTAYQTRLRILQLFLFIEGLRQAFAQFYPPDVGVPFVCGQAAIFGTASGNIYGKTSNYGYYDVDTYCGNFFLNAAEACGGNVSGLLKYPDYFRVIWNQDDQDQATLATKEIWANSTDLACFANKMSVGPENHVPKTVLYIASGIASAFILMGLAVIAFKVYQHRSRSRTASAGATGATATAATALLTGGSGGVYYGYTDDSRHLELEPLTS